MGRVCDLVVRGVSSPGGLHSCRAGASLGERICPAFSMWGLLRCEWCVRGPARGPAFPSRSSPGPAARGPNWRRLPSCHLSPAQSANGRGSCPWATFQPALSSIPRPSGRTVPFFRAHVMFPPSRVSRERTRRALSSSGTTIRFSGHFRGLAVYTCRGREPGFSSIFEQHG